jgi:surface antigen
MGSMLGDAIMNMLDCREQEQAATATETAVRGGNVGDSATWQSESRPGVTGTSTVTAVNNNSADGQCMTVTDVVIVDGEETRAPKQMCRRPPSNRYVRV